MKRRWNWCLWVGFLVVLVALFSYEFFVRFPITRDFPWANLLLFAVGGLLLATGLFRAYGRPTMYRGKVFGPILTALSLLIFGVFAYALFYLVRQMPPSAGAPKIGQKAPQFTLADQNGRPTGLSDMLASSGTRAVLLIFYRGYWWMLCNSELRSFQEHLGQFQSRGIRIAAISVDPVEINQRHARKMGYTFPFLSDPKAEVIRRYDLLHPHAGPKGEDISRPAEFLVDGAGTVEWRNLTEDAAVRVRPDQVLRTFDEGNGKTAR